jgi:hypothetical protein
MSLKTAYTELANVITGDADVKAWAASVKSGASLKVLKGNREVEAIDVRQLPALVLEMGDLSSAIEVAGEVQEGPHEMKGSVVFHHTSEETAFDLKHELAELVIKAVMNNGRLNGSVFAAWVSKVESDLGYNHPRHSIGFTVTAQIQITR